MPKNLGRALPPSFGQNTKALIHFLWRTSLSSVTKTRKILNMYIIHLRIWGGDGRRRGAYFVHFPYAGMGSGNSIESQVRLECWTVPMSSGRCLEAGHFQRNAKEGLLRAATSLQRAEQKSWKVDFDLHSIIQRMRWKFKSKLRSNSKYSYVYTGVDIIFIQVWI